MLEVLIKSFWKTNLNLNSTIPGQLLEEKRSVMDKKEKIRKSIK